MSARGRALPIAACLLAVVGAACGVPPNGTGSAAASPSPSLLAGTVPSAGPSNGAAPSVGVPASAPPPPPSSLASPAQPSGAIATPYPRPTTLHADPSLEALLPASIGDVALVRTSMPGSSFPGGGDICSLVCPDEPRMMAEAVGAALDDMTVAFAYEDAAGRLGRYAVVAFRVRGVTGAALQAARIGLLDSEPPYPIVVARKVGPETVTIAVRSWFPNDTQFLVVREDALIVILAATPESGTDSPQVPASVATVVAALP